MDPKLPVTTRRPEGEPLSDSPVAAVHLPGLYLDELQSWLVGAEQPRYRAAQIANWVFAKHADSFDQMTNLSKEVRAWLQECGVIYRAAVTRHAVSADGTQKLLLTWPDGAAIETVWIPDGDRNTACLSSQVGCPVGCRFCASGIGGVQRNLTAGEIVEQALRIARLVRDTPRAAAGAAAASGAASGRAARLGNLVLMGMGEPLANYDEVIKAVRILNAPWGLGVGARKITVSTVGLPKQIRRLAEESLQLNLALSLHAPDEELRRELIPWGKVPITELLAACDYYFEHTGREITLEYILLDGVNHQPLHARQLARIAKRLRCNVNLLRYNPVPGLPYVRPNAETTRAFQQLLRDAGVNAHLRASRGQDIDAACGQLRRASAESP
jgi:23S rRNA (adenine2503-C2)-methyltransferase